MKKEEKDESKERENDQKGKLDRLFLTPIGWPAPNSRNSSNQEMHKILSGDGESTDHIMATYWG
ncbi:MAG: hypothetical protein L7F78_00875 [Syntrophales bacterium LBB04]|nr:hypothetical protein [Syntrophales bacterium LBB04]